jgi:hypothetical protein
MRAPAAVLISACLVVAAPPGPIAAAADGFDAAYAGESAFLTLAPGTSGTLSVFFQNTGTVTWTRGTGTQVDLAACRDDKITCDRQDPPEARFNPGSWRSATRYASQSQGTVGPGQVGTFTYSVAVPTDQPSGTYRFNGELVVSATGALIHPEGYFHDVTVSGPSCTPSSITLEPIFTQRQVGIPITQSAAVLCAGNAPAANVSVTFLVDAPSGGPNSDLVLTAVTDRNGVAQVSFTRTNPGTDTFDVYITDRPLMRVSAVARWTIALRVLQCEPLDDVVLSNGRARSYTVTAWAHGTGLPLATADLEVTVRALISTGTATIQGQSALGVSGASVTTVQTLANGTTTFAVSGNASTIAPRVFIDENGSKQLDRTEFRVDCGSAKFGDG